jgi:ribonuclease P protein component
MKPPVLKENFMFSKVFKNGRYAANSFVTVYALKNYNRNAPSKFGVSASAKNGGAVLRNRAKRVVREASARLYSRVLPGYIIVVAARKPCFDKNIKMQDVLKSLESALVRLNLI